MARLVVAFVLFVFPLFTSAQVQKARKPLQIRAGFEAEWQASEKNTFYLDNQWRRSDLSPDENLAETGFLSTIEKIRLTVGYERALSPNWSLEVAQRVSVDKEETEWNNRLMLNYSTALNKTELEGRLMGEHIRSRDNTAEKAYLKPENRARVNLGLNRPFQIRKQAFEAAIESEFLFELSPEPESEPRLVDRTRLELGLTYFINKTFELNVFGIRQVKHETVTETQNEGNTEITRIYKRNVFTPILGVELNINIGRK